MSTNFVRIELGDKKMKDLIFSIEEFSTFDGPGIRTTVFLKGCPLRCSWCHNPEGQRFDSEIIKAQNGCIGCGACIKAGGSRLNEASIAVCPNRLLRTSGTEYTPESLVEKLEKNFDILNLSGGGITFSGGEPLCHPDFLERCLRLLKGRIHTAIQTSGYCPPNIFNKILALTDYFLYDIKLVDSELHKRYTGISNESILENFRTLCRSDKSFTVRTPLIPGVTDTKENITAIADLLVANDVRRIELLPYNKAAGGKYAAVGRTYTPDFDESVPVDPRTEIFLARNIETVVM